MKNLSFYADLINLQKIFLGDNPQIVGITADSRKVKKGMLFIARRGGSFDGNKFIQQAIDAGAVAFITDCSDAYRNDFPCILVQNTQPVLGQLMSAFYGDPSKQMKIVGVTGTNGKTTIATLLYRLFRMMDFHVGLLSTIENKIDDETIPASHTTPDAEELQSLLAKMRDRGCSYVFMEVSSHAVDQARIAGIDFTGAIFTNLTRDHLDYHKTFANYLAAKKQFFDQLSSSAFAIVNLDDKNGRVMVQNTKASVKTYALQQMADYSASIKESHIDCTEIILNGVDLFVQLVGKYNIYNLLAIYATAVSLGVDKTTALQLISALKPAAGRFETIALKNGAMAVVDYAHTPDALENILTAIRPLLKPGGALIVAVGAGGDRDRGKRPLMAATAESLADKLILTSDNPRTESPDAILNDMKTGLKNPEKAFSITDRREGIRLAISLSKSGDIILVAGKGHEPYQEINGVRHHFDDREVIRELNDALFA